MKTVSLHRFVEKYNEMPAGLKAAFWYTVCNFAQKAISVVVVPIYTRLLTSAEYGLYSVFLSWEGIFEILATFRLFFGAYTVGLVKFDSDRERYTSTLEKTTFIITTVLLIVYIIFQDYINRFTGMTTMVTLLMYLMIYAIPVNGFWKALQRVDNKYLGIIIIALTTSLLTPLSSIFCIKLFEASAIMVVLSRVGVEALIAVIILIHSREFFVKKFDFTYSKYALKISIPLIPFYLSATVLNHSDRIIIQNLTGSSKAGIYSVAYSAAMIMTLFNTAFNSSLQPWLFKRLKEKDYKSIPHIVTATTIFVAVLNLILIAFAPEVISILAPSEYHEATRLIPPLSASVFIMFYYQWFINIEFYFEESRITSLASIGAALINICLNFLLIPLYGYFAAGYTTLISYIIFWFMHFITYRYICTKNSCPREITDNRVLLMVTAAFFMLVILLTVGYSHPILRYSFLITIAVLIITKRRAIQHLLKRVVMLKM